MKNILLILVIVCIAFSCNSTKKTTQSNAIANEKATAELSDTLRISNDSLEYDVIIIEPGFNTWLVSQAKPEGFYTQSFLEARNIRYVAEWNRRVLLPNLYNSNLYELQIDYQQGIDYGYDVNYKLYNYFIYFQNNYNQNLLGGRVPIN
ncbi:DUF6146 family protein [Pontimicrobium sp. MEBiC01747]